MFFPLCRDASAVRLEASWEGKLFFAHGNDQGKRFGEEGVWKEKTEKKIQEAGVAKAFTDLQRPHTAEQKKEKEVVGVEHFVSSAGGGAVGVSILLR